MAARTAAAGLRCGRNSDEILSAMESRAIWQLAAVVMLSSGLAAAEPTAATPGEGAGAAPGSAGSRSPPNSIHSRSYGMWVYPGPSKRGQQLGYVRPGHAVRLARTDPIAGPGCAGGWYAVQPFGFVCLDRSASLSADDRVVRSRQSTLARHAPLPFRYALSNGAPMYRRLPEPEEWRKAERAYGPAGSFRPQSWGNRGHERLAEQRPIPVDGPVPTFLHGGGSARAAVEEQLVARAIPHGSLLSFTRAFEHRGRVFLLSADGTVVPADRVRPYRVSTFHGVELGAGRDLPIAWTRSQPVVAYHREGGRVVDSGRVWPPRTPIDLDGVAAPVEIDGQRYLPVARRGGPGARSFVRADQVSQVEPAARLPWGVKPDDKWIRVSITAGTLVAYEGLRPVFTTLVSPGAGGVPVKGHDPVKWSTTPLGIYRITFKHLTDDMSPEQGDQRSFWIADVPYAQYFNMPFALHTAYWHEDFGEPMSAGCVNLSPADGKWLFDWTDPALPPGWHGVIASGPNGRGSFVVIAR